MVKIKVSPLASRKAATKKALAKASVAAKAAAKSSKSAKPAKKVTAKVAVVPTKTLEPKKVGVLKAKLGKPKKLMPTAEAHCEPKKCVAETAGLPWRYIVNPDGSTTPYPAGEAEMLSAKLAAEQGASIHTLQIPRRIRTVENHTGYTSLSHAGDGIEDQLASDALAPKKRMVKAGPAKHPATPIFEEDAINTAAEREVYSHYHQRESFYTDLADAKSKAFLDIADLSCVAAAVDAIVEDVHADPHIIVNDRSKVLDQIMSKAMAAAQGRIPATRPKLPSAADDRRYLALVKVYEDIRKIMTPPPAPPETSETSETSETHSESGCLSMEEAKAGAAPEIANDRPARPTKDGSTARKYWDNLAIAALDTQEVMSLSDEYHDPIVKVLTLHGCSIVSMEPRQDIIFRGGSERTATIEMLSLVRDTTDASDTQLGILFLGAKRGFAGVEAATAGWVDAELIDVDFASCSRVYLMQKP